MPEEFDLSKHIWKNASVRLVGNEAKAISVIPTEDVKEFIRRIKKLILEVLKIWNYETYARIEEQTLREIDKLAGDKLKCQN
jgi:hypothetical protein